ncbi:hypothetical protein GX48_00162 [Paracoccidioides brasiliensis]|nr:hypothetical protein GX48_00162 [Paracoccidioides brasiliensis]
MAISDTLMVYGNIVNALQPSNPSEQWKVSLQEVKLLYFRRQYKQCAAKSTKLLREVDQLQAIHKAFLHYYCAISYEALGRGAHNYSSNKLPLLNLARDNFMACKSSLVAALPGSDEKKKQPQLPQPPPPRISSQRRREHASTNDKRKTYPATSPIQLRRDTPILIENETNIVAPLLEPAEQKTASQHTSVPSDNTATHAVSRHKRDLMPSPLRIHKICNSEICNSGFLHNQLIEYNPPSLPPPTRPLPELPPEAHYRTHSRDPISLAPHHPDAESIVSLYAPLEPQFYRHSIDSSATSASNTGAAHRSRINSTRSHCQQQQQWNINRIFPLPADSQLIPLITSLCTQLDANVKSTGALISKTLDLQRVHNAKKSNRFASFWSFTPTYDDPNDTSTNTSEPHPHNHQFHDYTRNNSTTQPRTSHPSTPSSTPPPLPIPGPTPTDKIHTTTTTTTIPSSSLSPSDETREQRIARLRTDGWMTVGLRSTKCAWKGTAYYERLCNEALAELYGNGRAG